MIAMPGYKDIHGATIRRPTPSRIMPPHVGVGGPIPNPRKLSPAWVRIAAEIHKVPATILALMAFGII